MKLFIFLLIGFFSSLMPWQRAEAQPQEIKPATYLRKISLHLRGVKPSREEYEALSRLTTPDELRQFFEQKITDYLSSPEHSHRMVYRLSERFQIRPPSFQQKPQDALTDLFYSLGRDNLSWDTLLIGKSYNLYSGVNESLNRSFHDDFDFFRILDPKLPRNSQSFFSSGQDPLLTSSISFAEDDPRIAGALTTPRFLLRYNTTNVNKNRRRAAAVFRLFLCDPMMPVVPPPPNRREALLEQPYPDQVAKDPHHAGLKMPTTSDDFEVRPEDLHGADPRCATCHVKLDPMGRAFQNIGLALHPLPSAGELTYTRVNGEVLRRYVRGLGDLGKEIVQQPEYLSCQIDWFWKEFIGQDVPLTPTRRSELVQNFEQVGRRTNDFIRTLLLSREFRQIPGQDDLIQFSQVGPLLQRCDTCHQNEGYIPAFANGRLDQATLQHMKNRLSLPDNDRRKMPRNWPQWNPNELETLKKWIDQGAPGPDGKPQAPRKESSP